MRTAQSVMRRPASKRPAGALGQQPTGQQDDPAQLALQAALASVGASEDLGEAVVLAEMAKRKCVHFTHYRTNNPEHVQPGSMTRQQFWQHLERVFKEAYPDPAKATSTGSILCFGMVCVERHAQSARQDFREEHKHCPTFSDKQYYWNKVARLSREKYKICLNAVEHKSYASMYSYVRDATAKKPQHELDAEPYFSPLHPRGVDLANLLEKSAASARTNSQRPPRQADVVGDGEEVKRKRAPDVYALIKEQKFESVVDLQKYAHEQAEKGDGALAEFCTRQGHNLQGLLDSALAVLDAPQRALDAKMTRMEKMQRAAETFPCLCAGAWADGATRVLQHNGLSVDAFRQVVCRALQLGAVRHVNVACIGPRGCGKSTLLESLELVFNCHGKPEGGSTFTIGDLPQYDIMLWQDYEHDEGTIRFTDFLSVLCGESLGARNPCKLNRKFRNKIPCFLSAHMPVVCGLRDAAKAMRLDGMMEERFTTFTFWNPVPFEHRILNFPQCGRCCAAFYLQGLSQSAASSSVALGTALPSQTMEPPQPTGMDNLRELVQMHRDGLMDEAEFRVAKRRLLGLELD
jgi:hypothetical protein